MFMTNKLTHIRNLFLNGNLDSFDFNEGKLRIKVTYNHEDENARKYIGTYFVQVDYNNCEAFHLGGYDDLEEVWGCIDRTLGKIEYILNDPKKALKERMKALPHATKEQHLKTIKEICE